MEKMSVIKWYETIDSTNNEMSREASRLDNLSVIAAEYQTSGRGQRGNRWKADAGKNLTFSILLKFSTGEENPGFRCPALKASGQFSISAIAAVAQCRFLQRYGMDAKIKWPNDIYVGDRKISGMLIENSLSGTLLRTSVIGIGLNVNQTEFPSDLPNPVSMSGITGADYDLHGLLEDFMSVFEECLSMLELPLSELTDIYESCLYRLGQECRFIDLSARPAYLPANPVIASMPAHDSNASQLPEQSNSPETALPTFSGIIRGVTPEGLLRVELTDRTVRTFAFKEIGYII